jgi:hypothetical protein
VNNFLYTRLSIEGLDNELRDFALGNIPTESTSAFTMLDIRDAVHQCPNLSQWFHQHTLIPRACAILVHQPGTGIAAAHTDIQPQALALNFGIENVADTWTSLYKVVRGEATYITQLNGLPYNNFRDAELEEITRYSLTTPVLFNTQIPHAVHNTTNRRRIALSFRFVSDKPLLKFID